MKNSNISRLTPTKRSSFLHNIIKHLSEEKLRKYGISPCKKCGGIGLDNLQLLSSGRYSWDGISLCSQCAGIGYIGVSDDVLKIDDTQYYCRYCFGGGCSNCRNEGKVDWIDHMMGR
jgi:hypothetical protein